MFFSLILFLPPREKVRILLLQHICGACNQELPKKKEHFLAHSGNDEL